MLKPKHLSKIKFFSGDRKTPALQLESILIKSALFAVVGVNWFAAIAPARSQALLPFTPPIDATSLEQQGLKLTQDAAQLLQFQQYDLALTRAKLATQLAPDLFQSWFILGTLYLQKEEYKEAIATLQKARELAPEEAGILFSLGATYFREGDYLAAVNYLEAGLKKEPQATQALFDLGNAYLKMERYPKAIDSYEKAVNLDAKFWPAINNVGLIQYERGDINGAIDRWQKALEIDKQQAEPELALAVAFFTRGQRQKGIKLGRIALQRDPRYGDIEFLRENLWGDRLIADTKTFMAEPQIRAVAPAR